MKLPYPGILSVFALLAAAFLLPESRPFAQSTPGSSATPTYSYGSTSSPGGTPAPGYSSSTSNFQSGSEGSLQYPGGLNFKVPVSLTGHSFALKYLSSTSTTPVSAGASVMGLITAPTSPGGSPVALYLAVAAPMPTGNQFNYTTTDWWLADMTGNLAPIAGQHRTLDLRTATWQTVIGQPNRYYAIASSRAGHPLYAGFQYGGFMSVNAGPIITTNGTSLNYFVGYAPCTGGQIDAFYYLSDRSDDKITPAGKTDVRTAGDWTFDPSYGTFPKVTARVTLGAQELGHKFTVHSRLGSLPETQEVWEAQPGAAGTTQSVLEFGVGSGLQFWITRDAENGSTPQRKAPASGTWAAGTNTSQPLAFSAISPVNCFPAPPIRGPLGQLVPHQFRIRASTRLGHTFSVRMSDGYTTFFNGTEHPDPATNTTTPAYGIETIATVNAQSLANPLEVYTFTAMIDPTRGIVLRDDSIAPGGGLAAEIPVNRDENPTDVFDGWTPVYGYIAQPGPTVTIRVPATRANHGFGLFSQMNYQPASYPWPNPAPIYGWPSPSPVVETVTYYGFDGMPAYDADFYTLTIPNSTPSFGGPFTLQDRFTLEPRDVIAGDNDLIDWFTEAQAVHLEISTSRLGHNLRVRHPNGEILNIIQLAPAVNNSLGYNRVIFSAPYYFFNATASARSEMPWYVEDVDTGERIGPSAGQNYPSNDALVMWIYVAPPTGLTAVPEAQGIRLSWVPGAAATGGGFIIERREGMSATGPFTPWHELKRVPETPATWLDTRLARGEFAIYRVRAFFGSGTTARRSPRSNLAKAAMSINSSGAGTMSSPPPGGAAAGGGAVIDPPGGGDVSWADGSDANGGGGNGASVSNSIIPGDSDGDGDPDNDKDGKNDVNDCCIDDPNRTKNLSTVTYATINASEGITDAVNGATLGEGATIAFWWDAGAKYGAAVWENGEVSDDKNVRYKKRYVVRDANGAINEIWDLAPVGVSADGSLAGTATRLTPASPVRKAAFVYKRDGSTNSDGDIEPEISQEAADTVCAGITPGGVIWGTRTHTHSQTLWSSSNDHLYWNWPCEATYSVTFIGGELFPANPNIELNVLAPGHYRAKVTWGNSGVFHPTAMSFNGGAASGNYSATDPSKIAYTPLPSPPSGIPIPVSLPDFKDASMSFWTGGTNFETVFAADPDTDSSVEMVSNQPKGIGTSTRLTNRSPNAPAGATHYFLGAANPPDIYDSIPAEFIKQIKIGGAIAESSDSKMLLNIDSLEGSGTGHWVARTLLLEAGSEPKLVEFPDPSGGTGAIAMQVNAAKNTGRIAAGKAKISLLALIQINETADPDDDFVAVSKGTDPDLATELSIQLPTGLTGDFTATLAMKGTADEIKFENTSVTVSPGAGVKVKMWGKAPSAAKDSSIIQVKLTKGTAEATTEKTVTVIDGLKLSFSGTFCSPIDAINEGWRPGTNEGVPPVTTAPREVIAADSADFSSNITFSDGDQVVTLRSWSPKSSVSVKTDGVEAIKPVGVKLPIDILNGAAIHMVRGKFEHNRNGKEKIQRPVIHFKIGTESIFSLSIVNPSDESIILPIGKSSPGVDVGLKIDPAAALGNKLALWLQGAAPYAAHADMRLFLNSLSTNSFNWKNEKIKSEKKSKLIKSVGAKAILGAQEMRGESKTTIKFDLQDWDGWDLSGKIEEGELTTP